MTTRYFVHPESACAWKQDMEDEEFYRYMENAEPHVDEVSEEEYLAACAAYGEEP